MSTEADPTVEPVVLQRNFRTALFGVRRSDVVEELGRAEADQLILLRDLSAARQEIERLQEEATGREDHTSEVRAELVRARQALERERQEFNEEKRLILAATHQHAEEITRRAERRLTEEGWELHRARVERQKFLESFRNLLTRYIAEIDELGADATAIGEGSVSPTEAVVDVTDRSYAPPGFAAPSSAPHGE